ncbi:hypothetical protein ACFL2V_09650 [Pseudomonadota bacterium]
MNTLNRSGSGLSTLTLWQGLLIALSFALAKFTCITALSYIMTFVMQQLTDGVGFSQVGYFVTLGGVIMGALLFDEPIGFSLVLSVALLFLGLALMNRHLFSVPSRLSK